MALMNWNDSLSVGVQDMDSQHKKLVDMINELHEAMMARKGQAAVVGLIAGLKDYAKDHFSKEEAFLAKHNYAELQKQKVAHNQFIEKVMDFECSIEGGKMTISMEVMQFLKTWLAGHIMDEDKKYGAALKDKNV